MPTRPTLQTFIDEELLRVPVTFDLVIDAVHQRWRERLPGAGRGMPSLALPPAIQKMSG